jgi:hypothetical protein
MPDSGCVMITLSRKIPTIFIDFYSNCERWAKELRTFSGKDWTISFAEINVKNEKILVGSAFTGADYSL